MSMMRCTVFELGSEETTKQHLFGVFISPISGDNTANNYCRVLNYVTDYNSFSSQVLVV